MEVQITISKSTFDIFFCCYGFSEKFANEFLKQVNKKLFLALQK